MINKQLETSVNSQKILEKLAENLGIDFVSEGSNLKKMVDVYTNEVTSFATDIDNAIGNGFISTMDSNFLSVFGRERGIPQKIYSSVVLLSDKYLVSIKADLNTSTLIELSEPLKIFNKGDIILITDDVIIEVLSDVYLQNMNDDVYISIKISLQYGVNSYVITEDTSFSTTPSVNNLKEVIPHILITFNRTVGLATVSENTEDYRIRLMEEEYRANNGANSLLASVVKEVPYISYIETENYSKGRAVKTIYPYTNTLIEEGYDAVIDEIIKPLITSNVQSRSLYGSKIRVETPEPLLLNVEVILKKGTAVSESYLYNITKSFNRTNTQNKRLTYTLVDSNLRSYLVYYKDQIENIKYTFTSPYVSEESFEFDLSSGDIHVPNGRFLFLNQIRGTFLDV